MQVVWAFSLEEWLMHRFVLLKVVGRLGVNRHLLCLAHLVQFLHELALLRVLGLNFIK